MSDFAIIIPASIGYLPGLNGILNALDYYGNTCTVEIVADDIPDSYFEEAQAAFDFDIVMRGVADLPEVHVDDWSMVRRLHFARYVLAAKLADRYEAIMLLDADCLILGDVTNQFKMAASSGLALAPHNVLGTDLFTYKEFHHTNAVPIANMPFFARPDKFADVFMRTIEISKGSGGIDDMPALYFALDEAGLVGDVVLLPDNIWLNNHHYASRVTLNAKFPPPQRRYYSMRERVYAIHKRWWQPQFVASALHGLGARVASVAAANAATFAEAYRFFNTQCKVKHEYE